MEETREITRERISFWIPKPWIDEFNKKTKLKGISVSEQLRRLVYTYNLKTE